MRTPTLVLVAIAALSSTFTNAAPTSRGTFDSDVFAVSSPNPAGDVVPASPRIVARDPTPDHTPTLQRFAHKIGPRALWQKAADSLASGGSSASGSSGDVAGGGVGGLTKRTYDANTLGGNARTGNSGSVDGGSIINAADNFGTPTFLNVNSNNGGDGGDSVAGCALGGHGNARGAGGNAASGTAGTARGGAVWNSGAVINMDSNNAGDAGRTQTGCATGGSVADAAPAAPQLPNGP